MNDYPLLEISDQSIQYIYGLDGLVALIKDGKVYTVLKDDLGSTRVVIDEAGTVIAAFDYLPFGDLMGFAYGNPEIISYRYTGQEFDTELGLYNYRARFYDPHLGRFYATDPAGQFASPYLYGGNNPIIMVDPDGEFVFLTFLAFGALIGGSVAAYKGDQEGLTGWDWAGYIAAGVGIGAVGGAVAFAGGVAAVAVGKAVASTIGVTSTAAQVATVATVAAGVEAAVGAGVGAAEAAAQFSINEAFGVTNQGSLSDAVGQGATFGAALGGAFGFVGGAGGAVRQLRSVARSARSSASTFGLGGEELVSSSIENSAGALAARRQIPSFNTFASSSVRYSTGTNYSGTSRSVSVRGLSPDAEALI